MVIVWPAGVRNRRECVFVADNSFQWRLFSCAFLVISINIRMEHFGAVVHEDFLTLALRLRADTVNTDRSEAGLTIFTTVRDEITLSCYSIFGYTRTNKQLVFVHESFFFFFKSRSEIHEIVLRQPGTSIGCIKSLNLVGSGAIVICILPVER